MRRILTINLQHGLSRSGVPTSPDALRAAFEGTSADVVLMQEVDRGQPRSAGQDQAGIVAAALGLPHMRFAATVAGDVRGRRIAPAIMGGYDGVGYGLAIASRWPVIAWFVRPLPRLPFRFPARTRRGLRWRDDEPRAVLAAVLRTPDGDLSVGCAHLSQLAPVAVWQARRALTAMAGLPGPRLLGGDLNLGSSMVRLLASGWRQARALTFPADSPDRQIDHLLAQRAELSGVTSLALPISDHRGLLARF
ncbi:MAG: endonuclease/exonuclease/phosphatase family protein [Beutenbergiaceae bacterium]